MHVQQISATLKFPSSLSKDSLTFKTIVNLPNGFSPTGTIVQWQIGGITGSATLNSKGTSPTSPSTQVNLKYKKPAKGASFTARPGTLTVTLKNQSLTALTLTGIANLNATTTGKKGQTASANVCVVLKGIQAYREDSISGIYKAKINKSGTFSVKIK